MTLVVSLRVPDGVVLAADSLQTTMGVITPGLKGLKVKDNTGKEVILNDFLLPPIPIPTSTFPFAQKLFSFKGKYGIATFGAAIMNQRTIYNHIKNLEKQYSENVPPLVELPGIIKEYFEKQLDEELTRLNQKLIPKSIVLGFQIVGYNDPGDITGMTYEVSIGDVSVIKEYPGIGCVVSGDINVVTKLWELNHNPGNEINYGSFSLKDAVDYVEYLINVTSGYQRFSNRIPTVGGETDIALVTQYSDFNWIKLKELTRKIELKC